MSDWPRCRSCGRGGDQVIAAEFCDGETVCFECQVMYLKAAARESQRVIRCRINRIIRQASIEALLGAVRG